MSHDSASALVEVRRDLVLLTVGDKDHDRVMEPGKVFSVIATTHSRSSVLTLYALLYQQRTQEREKCHTSPLHLCLFSLRCGNEECQDEQLWDSLTHISFVLSSLFSVHNTSIIIVSHLNNKRWLPFPLLMVHLRPF